MTINILMPGSAKYPVGGFKVIFEYVNGMSRKGHKINVIIPLNIDTGERKFPDRLKRKLVFLKEKIMKGYSPDTWFKFNSQANVLWVESLDEKNIPDGDILIATSWHTARKGNYYSIQKGRKIYFIQSLETWHGKYEDVVSTWKMSYKKIVIAGWLLEFARSINENATLINNGFNFESFGKDIAPEERDPLSIGMLYHVMEVKGSKYGLEAFIELKKLFPDLKITLFGINERPFDLPEWIMYYENPDILTLRKLYNSMSIFVNPSIMEGFALTPAEALICGCAIVVSDIGGHKDYSINNETALLFESQNTDSLIEKLKLLLDDNDKRITLANKGNKYIRRFNWNDSFDKFEKIILEK
jgi:glycosyltransferase involved in cell wall biosynthesis